MCRARDEFAEETSGWLRCWQNNGRKQPVTAASSEGTVATICSAQCDHAIEEESRCSGEVRPWNGMLEVDALLAFQDKFDYGA